MPDNAERHYRGEAGRKYQQEKRAVPAQAFPWVCRLRARKFQPNIKSSDIVLELGAGLGWNLAELKCARRIAVDVENFINPLINVEFLPTSAELPAAFADVVICHHVLEHVSDPPKMLGEAHRLLKPDGSFIIHVPLETACKYRRFDPHEPNHHLYSWNVQTLGNLLNENGWSVIEAGAQTAAYDRFAAATALKFGLGERAFLTIRRVALALAPQLEVRILAKKSGGGH